VDAPDGSFWIATAHALLRLPSAAVEPTTRHVLVAGSFWTLHVASDGSVWAGSEEGLFRFLEGTLRRVDGDVGLTDNFYVSIHEESDGTLWIGTLSEGLLRFRHGRFANLTTDDGIGSNGIWCILEDGDGGVWLSSDQGAFRVGHAELHAAADARERGDHVERLQPLHLTEDQGLPSREFNRASPPCQQLDDGRLVFNNLAGVVVIDPRHAAEVPVPHTVLRSVMADGSGLPLEPGDVTRIAPGTRHLQFDFRAISFTAPDRSRFRYRLQGYDQEWLDGSGVGRASYTSLPPGRYVFEVQATVGGGDWGEAARWPFVLPPHFWQTAWFRGLVATMLMATAVVAYRYRVTRLLEMERMRLRIASDLHDDLGAQMSTIALLSESLRHRERPDGRERLQLERIGTAAHEAMVALRDAIWLVDPKHDTVTALVQRMRAVASDVLADREWHFEVRGGLPSRRLEATLVRSAFLAYKEALTNVVRHSRAKRVDITIETAGGRLHVTVADDGIGFDPSCPGASDDPRSGGQGHGNMRRRAQEVGGRIEIDSAPGRGTRLRFSVPL
jgi:signal transduction histidine kinase